MEIIRIPRIAQDTCRKHLVKGRSVGFVPTMGALHDGHISLMKRAKMENDVTVASIFVNPIQFGPAEDFQKYPRPVEEDIEKLREAEIDTLLLPDGSLMYGEGFSTRISVDGLSERLCGAVRPGHFSGVATVVAKLFNIVLPARAYFGQKDFQQTVVIRKMTKDLGFPVEIIVCPTVREHDGLAMSSRNRYLSEAQRKAAAVIYRCLMQARDAVVSGLASGREVRELMKNRLSTEQLISGIDYASVFSPDTLEEVQDIQGEVLLAAAVRLGTTRLIDNVLADPRLS